jgi:hypothetical protein
MKKIILILLLSSTLLSAQNTPTKEQFKKTAELNIKKNELIAEQRRCESIECKKKIEPQIEAIRAEIIKNLFSNQKSKK